jgi:uncharacterized protein YjbI with pentapeptide repeats
MSAKEPMAAVFKRHFLGTESKREREVDAVLILHAVETGLRVDVRRAIIKGTLELRSINAEAEICLAGCDFKDRARFSYCAFKENVDLSGSIFRKGCCFRAAAIAGELRLIGATFGGPIARFDDLQVQGVTWMDRVRFNTRTSFRRAKFGKSAFFRHCRFDGRANFEEAQFSGEAAFTGAVFGHKVSFGSVRILGQAGFIGVSFKNDVSFNAARIESHALFRGGRGSAMVARFDGSADFTACQINSSADFRGAHFKGRANFNSVHIGGDAYFWSETGKTPIVTIFEQEADFTGARFGGEADFSGVIFAEAFRKESYVIQPEVDQTKLTSDAALAASGQREISKQLPYISFNGATFDGHARFSSVADEKHEALVTVFGLDADFTSARIGGLALFEGVRFERNAYFNFVHVAGNARFSLLSGNPPPRTIFSGFANFTGTKISGNATFRGAWFLSKATFNGMQIAGIADFECNKFEGPTAFDHANFSQDVHFERALFRPEFSFREASFGVVCFSTDGKVDGDNQFQGQLDLTGFTYNRIQVDWQSVLIKSDGSPRISFDLQSYNQLEKTFRLVGKDREADRIYLERCRVERRKKWNQGKGVKRLGWVGSALYGTIANYGVRPVRLAVYSFVLIVVGAIVFSQPGAVKPNKEERTGSNQHSVLVSAKVNEASQLTKLSFWEGLAVSVHQFLPVDIPSGSEWKPSSVHFIYILPSHLYGSFLRIAGWIFVPLGVAAVAGLLRRVR